MRLFITILLFLYSIATNATTYYVSNGGSDLNNGTRATPFATIGKATSVLVSYDSVKLFADGIWVEMITIPVTHITFDSFGTGAKPIVTGFRTLTGFTQAGNVWTATANISTGNQRCVLINSVFAHKARTPNASYLTFTSYAGDSIINTPETGTPSRVGKEIVVHTATWIIDVTKVLTQSTGQLKLSPKLTYTPALQGTGYFWQNDVPDFANEYSYDSATKSLSVYSATSPSVQISTIDTLVKCKKGTTFSNISFTGANQLIFKIDTSCTVKNSTFQYAGWDAIQGDSIRDALIDSNSIYDVWNNGITYDFTIVGHKLTVTNNVIRRIGIAAGMGRSGNGTYTGFLGFPDSTLIEYNRIDSVGYNAIHFYSGIIKHNYITNFGLVKVDAGGIYTFGGAAGNIIRGNIVGNGLGNPDGISGNNIATGIYLDDNTAEQIVDSNTVFNCKWASCFVHVGLSGNIITNNLFEDSVDRPFFNNGTPGLTTRKNIFYSRNPLQEPYYTDNNTGQTVDSNYYLRPTAAFTYSTDTHAMYMPAVANPNIAGTLFINPTKADSTVLLDQTRTYVDVNGKLYAGTLTLHPYQTIELFESTIGMLPIYVNTIK
jgi:parallel beta helix pectate lyase-like protein